MTKLSIAIATYNEEENIGRCLKSVKQIADEIVVVDGSSEDRTVEVAKKHGAKVIVTDNPPIFHINKQKALDNCSFPWILQLDADEEVTEPLAKGIKTVINLSDKERRKREIDPQKKKLFLKHQRLVEERDGRVGKREGEIVAYWLSRKNRFLGKNLIYGGVYPDGVIRLVKKGKARFPCQSVHEQIEVNGRTDWLEESLIHYASPTFSRYLAHADRYTNLTAEKMKAEGLGFNLFNHFNYLIIKPIRIFLSLFVRHEGFLEGFPGFVWALYSGLHFPIAYIKYWQKIKD